VLAEVLGRFVAALQPGAVPDAVAQAVELRILDVIGASLAGVHRGNHLPVMALLESRGDICIWGEQVSASPREAALVNSFSAHSTYLEDGSRFTGGHPSSVVVPAALAVAQAQRCSGAELIAAVVAGYEVFLRLGRAIYPSTVVRGFQSTAVLGAVSAAAACARLLHLPAAPAGHAIGMAASLGTGLKEALKSSASQPIQVGRSCEAGIVAAMLARGGLEAAPAIIERGFLPAFSQGADPDTILVGLGSEFRIFETYLKRHAGCRGNHAPLDAALALAVEHEIEPADIVQVDVFVDTVTLAAAIEPPANGEQAQFSIGFSVAVALLDGEALIFQYTDERVADPAVRSLMQRIRVTADPALDRGYPQRRGALVEVQLSSGRRVSHAVDNARGEPEWPLSADELRTKFMTLASPRLGNRAAGLADAVMSLSRLPGVAELAPLLRSNA
jgi:2-methylcitrate dehydratase PrpD